LIVLINGLMNVGKQSVGWKASSARGQRFFLDGSKSKNESH